MLAQCCLIREKILKYTWQLYGLDLCWVCLKQIIGNTHQNADELLWNWGGLYAKPALSGNQDVLIFSENHTQFRLTYTAMWILKAFVEPLWAIWRTITLHSRVENTPESKHLILNGKTVKRWAIFVNYFSVYMEEMCCQRCIKIVGQLTKYSYGLHWMTWTAW